MRKPEAEGATGPLPARLDTETNLHSVWFWGSHQALHLIWRLERPQVPRALSFSGGQVQGHAPLSPPRRLARNDPLLKQSIPKAAGLFSP